MGLFDAGRRLAGATGYGDVCDYCRDGVKVGHDAPCKVGQTSFALADYGNVTTRAYRIDFIIGAESLAIGRPDVGDAIDWRGRRFAVVAPQGEPCWRWHDRTMTTYRIHVEEVDNEQAD